MGAEWYDVAKTSVTALSNETMNEEEPDALVNGQIAISFGMDSETVLVGTPEEIFGFATRIQAASFTAPKFELTTELEEDEEPE
jgi:hypothetical protein